jgi:hypothetical protein
MQKLLDFRAAMFLRFFFFSNRDGLIATAIGVHIIPRERIVPIPELNMQIMAKRPTTLAL